MSEGIFREKSLERIQSPDNLNEYVRVASPAVWMVLLAVVILLVGAIVWGIFGRIETTVPARVEVAEGTVSVCIAEADVPSVAYGMPVIVGEKEYILTEGTDGMPTLDAALPDGKYDAEIVIQRIRPLSFVTN